jgi:hypothetical protein
MSTLNKISHVLAGSTAPTFQQTVIVPDCSFWQDRDDTLQKIDFQKMEDNGAKGVIIRLGQGDWTDEDFPDYWPASSGIFPRGLYWYYDSRKTPVSQAIRIAGLVRQYGKPEMEIWCDYEEKYNGAYKGWRHFAVFMAELEKLLPDCKLGIYTGYWYWLENSPNPITEKASLDWFGRFPLWIAWYTTNAALVKIPKPWTDALYWQFTATGDGAAYGVESKGIDLSYFNGTQQEFDLRYALAVPPVEPPAPPDTEKRVARRDEVKRMIALLNARLEALK